MPALNYENEIQKIFDLQFFGIKLGLVNIRALLADLGDPQSAYPVVLVAGTNGKGSIASTLNSICTEAGLTCGLFTSPHLIRFNERFVVNKDQITDDEVLEYSQIIWRHVERKRVLEDPDGPLPITFFEFATAMAAQFFKDRNCDLAIFECGLGGRLDATNALSPILDIFAPISFDHMQFLGNTLTSIATEKAGILRSGVPAVVGPQDTEPLLTLFIKFLEMEVPSFIFGKDFGHKTEKGVTTFWDKSGELSPVQTALAGPFQLENTIVAMESARVLQRLGINISDKSILKGPQKVKWPGRFETVAHEPEVILDGAHNEAGAIALAHAVNSTSANGKTIGIMSVMSDKEIDDIIRPLGKVFDGVVATKTQMPRALKSDILAQKLSAYNSDVHTASTVPEALDLAKKLAGPDGRVVICGSLFLVGESRAYILGKQGQGPAGKWVGVRG